MDFYLQTRDRPLLRDYRFLGRAPARAWWRERYHDLTAFEYPTALLESDAEGWRMLVSAIPSARRDATGAIIRWTVVVEGGHDESRESPDRSLALGLLCAWIGDLGAPDADAVCSRTFDAVLPAQDVGDWYDRPGEEVAARIEGRIREICERLVEAADPAGAADTPDPAGELPRSWIAALANPLARTGFLRRAEELVNGAHGRAILVNLLGDPAHMENAEGDVVVLIQDDEDLLAEKILPLPGAAKPPSADGNVAGGRESMSRRPSEQQESAEPTGITFPANGTVAGGITLRVGSMRVVLPRPEWRSEDGRTFEVTGTGTAASIKKPEKEVVAHGVFTVEGRRIEKGGGLINALLAALGLRADVADRAGEIYECARVTAIDLQFGGNSISAVPYTGQRRVDDGLEISVDLTKYTGERVERRAVVAIGPIMLSD